MHRYAPCLTLLLLASCLGVKDRALFEPADDSGGSAAGITGTDSGSGGQGGGTNNGSANAGGSGATNSGASSSGASSNGGTGSGRAGAEAKAGSGGSSGGTPPIEPPKITDCTMVEGATVGESGHCYRVNQQELDYHAAQAACAAAGGHLVTISSEEENELAELLHDGEHWIGASDGLPDTMAGVGTYTWVSGEAWGFSDWEDGQPNAFETNCPDQGDESDCFEHCAFQSDEGDWKDRSCWHTIVSICEWDVEAEPPSEGGSGAGGGAGMPSDPEQDP